MEARNPKFNAHGGIDVEINHPVHGWIPFTASPDDVEPLGPEIYGRAIAGEFGPIAPYVAPIPTPEQILAEKKRQRQAIVDTITVETSTGKIFDGNEEAQSRMSRAIQAAQIASIPSTTWVLANNVPTVVTLAELQEALVLSIQAMGAVWAEPYL